MFTARQIIDSIDTAGETKTTEREREREREREEEKEGEFSLCSRRIEPLLALSLRDCRPLFAGSETLAA